MATEKNKLLYDKITHEQGFNLEKKFNSKNDNKFVLKLLTTNHFIPFFIESFGEYTKILEKEEEKLISFQRKEEEEKEIQKLSDLQDISQDLKIHYKTRGLDQKYFLNLLLICDKDLENRENSHFRFIPNSINEVMNIIERKVKLTKSFRFYKNLNLLDRLQFNFNNPITSQDDPTISKKFFVDSTDYVKYSYEQLLEHCGCIGEKNRRLIYEENGIYNYLPILCKRYCKTLARKRFEVLRNSINLCSEETKCKLCTEMKEKMDVCEQKNKILEALNILYFKTCPFSHNYNEVMFHPLVYKTNYCDTQYTKEHDKYKLNDEVCPFYHDKNDFNSLFIEQEVENIYEKLQQYFKLKIEEHAPIQIKTKPCPLLSSVYSKEIINNHLHNIDKCEFYHNELEKQRSTYFQNNNSICPKCIDENDKSNVKWKLQIDPNKVCSKDCKQYHTRNELLFDKHNYRKIFDCPRKEYCNIEELCPYKHATDIKVNELYLPNYIKKELHDKITELKTKDIIINKLETTFLKHLRCILCYEIPEKIMYVHDCKHILCMKCGNIIPKCPLCQSKEPQRYTVNFNEKQEEYDDDIFEDLIRKFKNTNDLEEEKEKILNNSMEK